MMFAGEVVTPPTHLPITTTDEPLAAAVTEELERVVLWRAIVRQTRRIVIDGPLPPLRLTRSGWNRHLPGSRLRLARARTSHRLIRFDLRLRLGGLA